MDTIYTPQHVANFILKKESEINRPITQLKLLKLVYLLYGWVIAVLDRKMFDEPIEAWKFGPVIPSLRDEFKRFGYDPIEGFSIEMNENGRISMPFIPCVETDLHLVMDRAWRTYSPFTASALVSQSHEPKSPWANSYHEGNKTIIKDSETKQYFRAKIKEYLVDG